jgi:hypothetical protein
MSQVANSRRFKLTVMPDYGFGPYAWLKDATDASTLLSDCVGTAVDGFELPDGTTISLELQAAFAAWISRFECDADKPAFDWGEFHEQGRSLSAQLKQQLGPDFAVIYHKPCEDPEHDIDESTEVASAA